MLHILTCNELRYASSLISLGLEINCDDKHQALAILHMANMCAAYSIPSFSIYFNMLTLLGTSLAIQELGDLMLST